MVRCQLRDHFAKLLTVAAGHTIGAEIEEDFTRRAEAAGMTEAEAKNAYNHNMMGGGLLADGPAEFAKEHGRRWLLTEYEAGDVVFHNSYAVSLARALLVLIRADSFRFMHPQSTTTQKT